MDLQVRQILKSAEDSANYRALFQSLTKSMFCNCIYNSYNVNVNFINDEFINEFGHLKCLGVAFKSCSLLSLD